VTAVPSSGNGRLIRLTVCQKIRLRRPLRIRPFPPNFEGGPAGEGCYFSKAGAIFSYSSALDIMHAHGALKQFVSYSFSCLKLLQCWFLGGAKGIVFSGRFTLTVYQYVPYVTSSALSVCFYFCYVERTIIEQHFTLPCLPDHLSVRWPP